MNGVLLAFLSYSAFALSDASIKLLAGSIDPFQLTFFGALLGFAALPFVRRRGERYSDVWRSSNLVRSAMLDDSPSAVDGDRQSARASKRSSRRWMSVIAFTALP